MTTETIEAPDRRAAIEAAFEAAEKEESTPVVESAAPEPKGEPAAPEPKAEVASPTEAPAAKPEAKPAETAEETEERPVGSLEKPPQAWKPAQKAKWSTLDPEVRLEVLRRERETTKVLNESAQARHFANEFTQIVSPYMARIKANNTTPVQAVQALLNADHILSSAPGPQRAQFMAKMITDYGVNLEQLDAALSGRPQVDPVENKVEQLVAQRLAPFQQFMSQQEQARMQQVQAAEQSVTQIVSEFANDPKYEYFNEVRDTMADIIELAARRGRPISIETAYNQAVAIDPDISKAVQAKANAQAQAEQAAALNSKAQRALQASVSVGGAPAGSVSGSPSANNRRAVIEAAFAAAGGR